MALAQADCEKILWAEVMGLSFDALTSIEQQGEILTALCRSIRDMDGQGFAVGVETPVLGVDALADAVRKAVGDEYAAVPPQPPFPSLLLWTSADGLHPDDPPAPFESWAYADRAKVKRYGPLKMKAAPAGPSFYLFAALDRNMAYSRATYASKLAARETGSSRQMRPGLIVSVVALLAFVAASFSTIQIGNVSRLNADEFMADESAKPCWSPREGVAQGRIGDGWLCGATDKGKGGVTGCCELWVKAGKAVFQKSWLPWIEYFNYYLSGAGRYSVRIPFFILMASLAAMLAGAGLMANGSAIAVFVDPQSGRISLSRFQAVTWTVLLLGGYATLTMYNIGFSAKQMVLLQQLANAGGADADQGNLVMFPKMDMELWLLLGVAAGSPYFSALLSKSKNGSAPAPAAPVPGAPAPAAPVPGAPAPAAPVPDAPRAGGKAAGPSFTDLFLETDPAIRDQLDLTRLQNLFFTGMLLISYFQLLFKALDSVEPGSLLLAAGASTTVFPAMPAIDSSFLALLVLSHGVYLVRKKY